MSGFKSEEVMKLLKERVAKEGASYVEKVGGVYLFAVTKGSEKKHWLVDLKTGTGSVKEATEKANADCTITTDDDSFFGLFTGKVNPQDLFFGGKLKIDGDMGLAMSLSAVTEGAKL
eukprot:c3821_g1_i1.p1 GENE.c3821_g1_i1~~c3821_g1_i1.p1  ORF type:complete len:117 (-),score=33.92 c3821_g1_i1:16-366(-)